MPSRDHIRERELADSALRLSILELSALLRQEARTRIGTYDIELFRRNVSVPCSWKRAASISTLPTNHC